MKDYILKSFLIMLSILFFNINSFAVDMASINNSQWANLHLYMDVNQRGGPYSFDDTYVELEFGGRYEWLDLY